jgi:hypothetical protein
VSPLIWRRLLVVSETSLGELHEMLQSAFGWSGEHLHRFLINGVAYGIPHVGGIVFREDARGVPLSRFRLHCGERFCYEYDFTADWRLDIRLEGVLPFDSNALFRHASTEGELRRRKIVLEPGIISSGCIGTEADSGLESASGILVGFLQDFDHCGVFQHRSIVSSRPESIAARLRTNPAESSVVGVCLAAMISENLAAWVFIFSFTKAATIADLPMPGSPVISNAGCGPCTRHSSISTIHVLPDLVAARHEVAAQTFSDLRRIMNAVA